MGPRIIGVLGAEGIAAVAVVVVVVMGIGVGVGLGGAGAETVGRDVG